jgi:predicted phage terminase large subunit-like protein
MAKTREYSDVIKAVYKEIERLFKTPKLWDKEDEKIIQLFSILKEAVFEQVHNVLAPQRTASAEKELRDILAKYVIGYTEKKKSVNFIGAISPIRAKLVQLKKTKAARSEYIARYLDLYDDFMALAAFRSYKHYCIYMEDVFGIKLWSENERAFSGYWYYAGRMVLDGDIRFMEKQLPTGTGKSLSDCFLHSWIFGVDIDSDVFKVCGNDKFTDDCFSNVADKLMVSEKYAKVFPYYAQFNCQKELMFAYCDQGKLKFSITGSKKSTNLRIATKLSKTNGVRAKYLFLDDICQQDDTPSAMENDIMKFKREWFRRNYNLQSFYITASGTTYSQFDILSYLKREMGFANAEKSKINEFTWVSKSNYITRDGVSIFVKVPALDDKDESVFPTIRDTFTCRKLRETDFSTFMAMEQQEPLPPVSSPFYFTKLRQYTTLPKIGECGRLESCVAALDTKRRGKDFLSMPIFFEADDPENANQTVFYLKDWLYDDRPMKECLPLIVSKIIQHKITRLYVERNTEECIETLIQDKLREQGYTSCVIEEVYSTEPKDRRIMSAEGDIKARMVFPQYGMYSQSNDIGKALMNFYGYTYTGTVAHDDAPDSLALFAKRFVMNATRRYGKVTTFRR